MARRPRVEYEGAIYHVTARIVGERAGRGVEGRHPSGWLFRDERDHQAFMDRLIDRIETYNIRLTQREAADVLQVKSSAAVSKQQHRLSEALEKNRGLRRRVRILETTLAEMVRP